MTKQLYSQIQVVIPLIIFNSFLRGLSLQDKFLILDLSYRCASKPPSTTSSSYARKLNADGLNHLDSCTPFPSSLLESSSRAILPPGGTLLPVYTNWPSSPGITVSWYVFHQPSAIGPWLPLRLRLYQLGAIPRYICNVANLFYI